ncbi:MerR family transcriptional regulator [Cohnella xylanilytica]|uniref:MerR family transcriptional regulator n=1 Tax=Cohnella xylanilytica TaxID=557555 RepID=A0A841U9B6_9BACL|nr:MerR family transcriptional regulator [Cohnella xylanilytica]MBB6695588.1 MerR family transcriptional regulator [Cohnella xylanilytica]
MEYTVQKLGRLAGISTRTLRYYDEIGILKPARASSSGYRIYGPAEVDRLQQILFYRELGVGLEKIKEIVSSKDFDGVQALREHRRQLLERREQLDRLIANVDQSIAQAEGRTVMSDQDKFEGFKRKMIEENENKYGKEVREKYGDDVVNRSNEKLMGMTQEQHAEATRLAEELTRKLAEAFETGDPAGEKAREAVELHKRWLLHYWTEYSPEAHAGLGRMYVEDERFKAHYDVQQPGTAEFLRDAILAYTGIQA